MRPGLAALLAAVVALLAPAAAHADLPQLLAACAPKDGVVFCDDGVPAAGGREPNVGADRALAVPAAYQGFEGLPAKDPVASLTVPGNAAGDVALDADLTLPEGPAPPGGRPLLVFMHGCCSGNKTDYDTTRRAGADPEKLTPSSELWHYNNLWFARRGYAVLTYTSRGFVTTDDTGDEGSTGESLLDDRRFEINDLQHLVGQLVDTPSLGLDPARVATVGGSYGGGFGWMALTDPRWRSPGGKEIELAAVVTKYGWTDLVESLVPDGRDLPDVLPPTDPEQVTDGLGMVKRSFTGALFASGVGGLPGTSRRHATFPPQITETLACLTVNDPSTFESCPDGAETVRSFARERSAYYQNGFFDRLRRDPSLGTPVWVGGTFSDQLFPAIESLRMVKRLRETVPDLPIQQYFGDYLHAAQNKAKEWADLCGADRHVCKAGETDVVEVGANTLVNRFLDHHLRPVANVAEPAPASDVTASLYVCKTNASAARPLDQPGERFTAPTFEALAPGTLQLTFDEARTTTSVVPANTTALRADPVVNAGTNGASCPNARETSPRGTASWQSEPLPEARTMLGLGRVTYAYRASTPDPTSLQLNTRLYDVAPDGTATLVDRGVRRLDAAAGTVTYALHGQGWRFEPGHAIRVEATQDDDPYVRRSSTPSSIAIDRASLALPVRERSEAVPAAPVGRPSCAAGALERTRVVPRGRGLRVVLAEGAGRVTVDVFQQTQGRLVLGERRVARLRGLAWAGGRGADGLYVVRVRKAAGREARFALVRRGGRFAARPAYATQPLCGALRQFKLERPVFGGVRNRALGIAFRLRQATTATVTVTRGGRAVRTSRRAVRAGALVRLRLPSERIGRGDVRVRLRAPGVDRTLIARRL